MLTLELQQDLFQHRALLGEALQFLLQLGKAGLWLAKHPALKAGEEKKAALGARWKKRGLLPVKPARAQFAHLLPAVVTTWREEKKASVSPTSFKIHPKIIPFPSGVSSPLVFQGQGAEGLTIKAKFVFFTPLFLFRVRIHKSTNLKN